MAIIALKEADKHVQPVSSANSLQTYFSNKNPSAGAINQKDKLFKREKAISVSAT